LEQRSGVVLDAKTVQVSVAKMEEEKAARLGTWMGKVSGCYSVKAWGREMVKVWEMVRAMPSAAEKAKKKVWSKVMEKELTLERTMGEELDEE